MISNFSEFGTTLRRTLSGGRQTALWGDGFADDGFLAIASVESWDHVCADEYVRLFPKLVGRPSRGVIAQLERHAALPLPALDEDFSAEGKSLDELLHHLHAGRLPDLDPSSAAAVAFWGAIHPAYFWPKAVADHQKYSALGWLGMVMRGRPALMPVDVAEYLAEAIDADGRIATDEVLFERVLSPEAAYRLRGLAALRLAGHRPIVWPDCLRRRQNRLNRYWKRRLS